jgi:gamma-carbonic anhydrase
VLFEHEGRRPTVAADAWVAPTAVLVGDVVVGPGCRVLHQAVLTDDGGPVELDRDVTVMEHALLRGREAHPVRVGASVLIGPHAHVNGATIEAAAFVATGAAIFPGAFVGRGAEIRINGVVHVNTRVAEAAVLPIGWVAVGDPAQFLPPEQHEAIWRVQRQLDFPGTLWGLSRSAGADQSVGETQEAVGRWYRELFGRHIDDRPVEPDPTNVDRNSTAS